MGLWDKVKKAAGGVASTAVSTLSVGTVKYNPNTGGVKVNTDAGDIGQNFASGMTGGEYMDAMNGPLPELPKAIDPNIQAKRAEAEAAAKLAEQVGVKGRGLSSTVLGGSVGTDSTVLKKRKLLGE